MTNGFELDLEQFIPRCPNPTDEDWAKYQTEGDCTELFFDWYRWTGAVTATVAYIQPDSPDYIALPSRDYHVLSGLLNRCAKLIHAIVAMTFEGRFGESASILHRSLTESALKIMWICNKDTSERVFRFVADGLRPEIEFEAQIKHNIKEHGGVASELEARMLRSIQRHFDAAEITRELVESSKKLPAFDAILTDIGYDRLQYVVLQRIGSHAVHGTWPSLFLDYLCSSEIGDFPLMPKADSTPMHVNQYMMGSKTVLEATQAFVGVCLGPVGRESFGSMLSDAYDEMMSDYDEAINLGFC